jgi:hypothetical protein
MVIRQPDIGNLPPRLITGTRQFFEFADSFDKENLNILFKKDGKSQVITIDKGEGTYIFIADTYSISNLGLGIEDNALFYLALVQQYGSGKQVYFDEYHFGISSERGIIGYTQKHNIHYLFIQLAFCGLFLVWRFYPRFGQIIPLKVDLRRESTEYISSMAIIYRKARMHKHLLGLIHRYFGKIIDRRRKTGTGKVLILKSGEQHGLNRLQVEYDKLSSRFQVSESELLGFTQKGITLLNAVQRRNLF